MDLTIALADVRKATESRLTLLGRVRQPKLVYLDGQDDTAYQAAFDAYWNEVRDQCGKLTETYRAAGADPNSSVISGAKVSFETFDRNLPKQWLIQPYGILPPFFYTQEAYRGR
jgi:hypothetical protein